MKDFRKLEVWQEALSFVELIYRLTDDFPSHEKYNLINQMRRAAVSIPSNIAEGCRGSNKELIHFLNISLGSSFELETQLILVKRLYSKKDLEIDLLIDKLNTLQKRMNAYRTFIKGKLT